MEEDPCEGEDPPVPPVWERTTCVAEDPPMGEDPHVGEDPCVGEDPLVWKRTPHVGEKPHGSWERHSLLPFEMSYLEGLWWRKP